MKLVPNPAAIDRLLKSDDVKRHEMKLADNAAATTRRLASRLNERHVKVVTTGDGVAVVVDSSFWHFDEFGVRDIPARAPLRRGMEAAGLQPKGR